MTYQAGLEKAWDDLKALKPQEITAVKLLADEYTVDLKSREVISLSCNAPAKDFTAILILHYLIQDLKGTVAPTTGEWINFKEFSGIEGYYPTFRKRAIEPIIRKYGNNPEAILEVIERLPAKKVDQADIGIVIEAFKGIPVLITLWRPDEEFGPEANVLFDKSIMSVFCTEDIVVLAGIIASQL